MTKAKTIAQWEKLQADYKKADEALDALISEARAKWGPQAEQWASTGVKKKIKAARARASKISDRMFDWLEKHSPWDFAHDVPTWWVKTRLSAHEALSNEAPIHNGRKVERRTVPVYDERGVVRHVPVNLAPNFTKLL